MITEHYVEKSGYWIYNKQTKTLTNSSVYPYPAGTVDDWIYVDGPGTIRVKDDKILNFTPKHQGFDSLDQDELKCWVHKPKEYIGFTEKYFYCSVCGAKL